MIAFRQSDYTSLLIGQIEEANANAGGGLTTLVFAEDDPLLLGRLRSAMRNEAAVILPAPQASWVSDEGGVIDTVVWALGSTRVESLLLVGSSAAEGFASIEPAAADPPVGAAGGRLFDCVQDLQQKRLRAQQHFVEQADALAQTPEVQARLADGGLRLDGLFYRAESGVFAAYKPLSGKLQPLLA